MRRAIRASDATHSDATHSDATHSDATHSDATHSHINVKLLLPRDWTDYRFLMYIYTYIVY